MSKIEHLSGQDHITVPSHLLSPRGGDHYVLRVVGDSMIEESIADGDYVIVLRRDQAESGEMVLVLTENSEGENEATIKRYYPEDDGNGDGLRVRLQPANPAMQPIVLPASEVRVQGIVVGLMRKF